MGMNIVGASIASSAYSFQTISQNGNLTVNDLNNFLNSLHEKGKQPHTVDRIIIGDPDMKISKIGTCWMPYWKTLKKAVKSGVNTLVVHEPTFYKHFDFRNINDAFKNYPDKGKKMYLEQIDKKKEWIEKNNIAIIRCHDVWDIFPEKGIPFAFGMALGYSNNDIIRSEPYYNVYEIQPKSAKEVAKDIAGHLLKYSQPGVAFYGEENRIIKTVGLGTGCICDPIRYMSLNPDLFIAIDDSVSTWTQTCYAEDTGHPLVVVNHGTSEENGMIMLNEFLKKNFSKIDVIHFKQGCTYKWITA